MHRVSVNGETPKDDWRERPLDRHPCNRSSSDAGVGKFARVQAPARLAYGRLAGSSPQLTASGGAEASAFRRGRMRRTALLHQNLHRKMHLLMQVQESLMRTTVTLDDQLVERAVALTGCRERSPLLREALNALIERESARRLARLGGTDPEAAAAPRSGPDA